MTAHLRIRWVRFFYNLFFPFAFVALLPGFLMRMLHRGGYRYKFAQRFAFYSPQVHMQLSSKSWTWIHAVSVGEVLIALKLIRHVRAEDPTRNFVLSTTTSTGFALANKEASDQIEVIYNPIDFLWAARRAIRLIRPQQLILVEAEVWPNLVCEAKQYGANIVLVNARLSQRSEKRYRSFRWFVSPLFKMLDAICIQEPSDIHRWTLLGIRRDQLHLTGSIKFDDSEETSRPKRDLHALLLSLGCPHDARILLGASTHAGEEKILAKVFLSIRQIFPNTLLLIAPRHTERVPEVLEDLRSCGLNPIRRSRERATSQDIDCVVIDTTGELKDWYFCSNAVFIGKSLTARGGQNPAEAVIAGKPVTFGPNMQNFRAFTHMLLSENGAIVSHNKRELENNLLRMLSDQAWAQSICNNAANCLSRHRGATERTAQILRKIQHH